jgi:hypothetical protein
MTRRLRTIGTIVLLLLAFPTATLAAGGILEPAQPTVEEGQWIVFSGSGFTPDEQVVSWATAPDQAVLGGPTVGADADGRFELEFRVPRNVGGGRWALTAFGRHSRAPVVAYFEVIRRAPDAAAPQAAASPSSGPRGTLFAFAAFGYKGNENVSYWFTGPDGQVYDAYPEGTQANRDGRVDIRWRAPSDALLGKWVITIQGVRSDVARGMPFEIR